MLAAAGSRADLEGSARVGITSEQIDKVRAPLAFDWRDTPEEIAVSVVAE